MDRFVLVGCAWFALTAGALAQSPSPSPSPGAAASPAPEASVAPSHEFELTVGTQRIEVAEGQPFTVEVKGEKLTGVLRRLRTRTFAGEGVTFEYDSDFKVSTEREEDAVTITLDHPKSPTALVQVYPGETKPDNLPKELLDGIKGELKTKSATQIKEGLSVQREFKPGKLTGQALEYQVEGQTTHVEVYAFTAGKKTLAVTLQWDLDEAELAKDVFTPLSRSLAAP